jgi:MFS transporter, PAT family, beta-lactamase induction signal transducer AmpG
MGLIWWALPSILSTRGIDLEAIASLSALLTLPWVFKFLMGPVMDLAVAKGWRLRVFITACQIMMGIFLLALLPLDWATDFRLFTLALFLHGCFAATQDVAIDALALRIVPADELGPINGWMQTGMLGGRAIAAASVVTLVGLGQQQLAVLFVLALIWLPMLALHWASPDERIGADEVTALSANPIEWKYFFNRILIFGLFIALTAGAGFEFFTISVGPLLQELGGSQEQLTLLFGLAAPIGLATGALTGGFFCARYTAHVATLTGIILVGLGITLLSGLMLTNSALTPTIWLAPIVLVYIATGFLTAATYTLLMQLAKGKYAATRFAIFMSATNGCEVWIRFLGGKLTTSYSHAIVILILAPISLLAAPALLYLRYRANNEAAKQSQAF